MNCVLSDMKKMQIQELEKAFKGQRDMKKIHYRGEGPHWAVVPIKKEKKKEICQEVREQGRRAKGRALKTFSPKTITVTTDINLTYRLYIH